MRKGWGEMGKEQQRIKDGLARPVWQKTGPVPVEKPDVKEQQQERLLQMRAKLKDKIARLDAEAAKLEQEALQAELKVVRLAEDVGLVQTAAGRGKLDKPSAAISRPLTSVGTISRPLKDVGPISRPVTGICSAR